MIEHDERGELDPIAQEDLFRRGYIHSISLFLVIVALVLGGYYAWSRLGINEADKASRDAQRMQDAYEAAMRADTYGGKTPEETLDLLVDALKLGDIKLASKYFILEQNPRDPDYLTWKKWEDGFGAMANENRIQGMIDIIANSTRKKNLDVIDDLDSKFELTTANGEPVAFIDMGFNTYSGVWKVESL